MFYTPAQLNFTIPAGQSVSNAHPVSGRTFLGILTPDAWDAAALTFQGSIDGTAWFPLVDEFDTERSFTINPNRLIATEPRFPLGFPLLRLRSGTFASGVTQAAPRTLIAWLREWA